MLTSIESIVSYANDKRSMVWFVCNILDFKIDRIHDMYVFKLNRIKKTSPFLLFINRTRIYNQRTEAKVCFFKICYILITTIICFFYIYNYKFHIHISLTSRHDIP